MAKKKTRKNIEKQIKKMNPITLILVALFLVVGLGAGLGTAFFITRNDVFEINGKTEIRLSVGETYEELGAKAIAFGKDISSSVKIDGEVDTAKEGRYVIKYTVDNFRFKDYVLYKLVIVEPMGG